jgi:hypothetical protein
MKILLAKTAGFCMGVRRAVEMVLDAPSKYENPICTYGPLIHNPLISTLGFALAICPVFIFIVLSAHELGYMLPGTRLELEFLVETNFITAGIIPLIWSFFNWRFVQTCI